MQTIIKTKSLIEHCLLMFCHCELVLGNYLNLVDRLCANNPEYEKDNFRLLEDGTVLLASKYMFTWGLHYGVTESGYAGRYCYPSKFWARYALYTVRKLDAINHPFDSYWIKHKGIPNHNKPNPKRIKDKNNVHSN